MRINTRSLVGSILLMGVMVVELSGLAIIDDIDYVNAKFEGSEVGSVIELENINTEGFGGRVWNSYRLSDSKKYLVSRDILHEFEGTSYLKTLRLKTDARGNKYVEKSYLERMEDEDIVYKKSGFSGIPKIHLTTVNEDAIYYAQRDNEISPETSCLPSVVAMYLSIKGKGTVGGDGFYAIPDYISSGMSLKYGSNICDIRDSLNSKGDYYMNNVMWDSRLSKSKIVDSIKNNEPLVVVIDADFIDYYYMDDDEEYNNLRRRVANIYKFKDTGDNHAVLVTGFLEIDGDMYVETYDPNAIRTIWANGAPVMQGKGQYIKYDDFKDMFVEISYFNVDYRR